MATRKKRPVGRPRVHEFRKLAFQAEVSLTAVQDDILDKLADKLRLNRGQVIRKALGMLATKEKVKPEWPDV